MEFLTGYKFAKVRPEWIVNGETNKLELDGFCEELNIAFEYNGSQHYKFEPHFHKTVDDFNKQVEHDRIKSEACIQKGVSLISIPYTLWNKEKINSFVLHELNKCGYLYDMSYLDGFTSIW